MPTPKRMQISQWMKQLRANGHAMVSLILNLYIVSIYSQMAEEEMTLLPLLLGLFIIIMGGYKLVGHGATFLHAPDSYRTEALAVEVGLSHLSRIIAIAGTSAQRPR